VELTPQVIATITVAVVGILLQVATGYGIYRAFVSRADTKFIEIDRRLEEVQGEQGQQWTALGKVREEIAFIKGLFAATKGKGATV
jgi:hypothetical protein